jgi:antitoxin component YwqK of YwqJK toxin-antitoxin module
VNSNYIPKKSEGNFKDGEYDGKWIEWDENGQIKK